ncbi:MAG: protein arginine kinase [Gemmatimonadota bacterium]|jgi:protein arginine kinase|nr:protein arginine kinase [Gemmatimonadota bacterium]
MRPLGTEDGLEWLEGDGPSADVVLSTRVRLARNLRGYRFGPRSTAADRSAVLALARKASTEAPSLRGGSSTLLAEADERTQRLLLERHLVSRELVGEDSGGPSSHSALLLGTGGTVGVMVNEEDHLRLQSLISGFRLREGWRCADRLDEELGAQLPYAFHNEFGYLTSCPTNVGTGLRASVLIHLPGLVLTQEIGKVLQGITQMGLTFRGLHGEGSEVVGNFFQISNQTTLGKTEEDLIEHLENIVRQVIQYEAQARSVLLRDAPTVIEDKVWRAYGLLCHARTLGFEEVMNLLSGIRLGVGLKLLPRVRVYTLNRIMIFAQAAHLQQMAGKLLSESEADVLRAAYVRRTLGEEGDPSSAEGSLSG